MSPSTRNSIERLGTTTPADAEELLAVAREAAAAGAAVLAERDDVVPSGMMLSAAESGVRTKSSEADLVTDFDRRAEEAVRAVVARRRPDDAVTGEEYGTSTPQAPSGYRWSIDPLDGTTNFVRGIVYYGTSVGVMGPDGDWLAGVVHAPALGRIWWARRGAGAWTAKFSPGVAAADTLGHRSTSEPVRLHHHAGGELSAGLLSTGFGYDAARRQEQSRAVLAMLPHFGNIRRLGAAALDICMVADGSVDAYAEYGIWEHDWAAAALIAEEAGAPVRRPAEPDSSVAPDWCVVGSIGIPHEQLRPAPLGE